jgi:hypothetical protein
VDIVFDVGRRKINGMCGSRVLKSPPRNVTSKAPKGIVEMAFVKKNPWIVLVVVFGALIAVGIAVS